MGILSLKMKGGGANRIKVFTLNLGDHEGIDRKSKENFYRRLKESTWKLQR